MEKNETTKDDKAFEVNFAKKFFFFCLQLLLILCRMSAKIANDHY